MQQQFTEREFLACIDAIRSLNPNLSPLTAGIVTAVSMGVATDSRMFAKMFGIEHALVLREINLLTGPDAPIEIIRRDARTQRTHLKLTVKGEVLCPPIP